MPDESIIASTAGGGSLLLEFGTLPCYTRSRKYYDSSFNVMAALHGCVAETGLVSNDIDIGRGWCTARDAGVGGLVDSY